jgi:hypothetical protein
MARRNSMRDKMRKKLADKTKESYTRRDSKSNFKTFFNKEKTEGLQFWWAEKGEHIIDIVPYIAGKNDPRNVEGDPTYVLDVEVHMNVGPMSDKVVCLGQYNKPCPICEEATRLNREGADWKTEIKPLRPSRRALYNVIVRDGGEHEKKGVQILEIAHFFMERHLSKIAKDPRGGGFVVFSDPDDGKSISFERTGVGAENTGYDGHRFVDRIDPITDKELDDAKCLDDLLDIKTYDEIYELFHGKDSGAKGSSEQEAEQESEQEDTTESKKTIKKKIKKYKKIKCPGGGKIGKDIDEHDECDDCEYYNECEYVADNS